MTKYYNGQNTEKGKRNKKIISEEAKRYYKNAYANMIIICFNKYEG